MSMERVEREGVDRAWHAHRTTCSGAVTPSCLAPGSPAATSIPAVTSWKAEPGPLAKAWPGPWLGSPVAPHRGAGGFLV